MALINAEYWIWLFALPVSLGMLYLLYRRVKLIINTWFSPDEYERSYPQLKMVLRGSALLLAIFALLGPSWGGQKDEIPYVSRDIYLMLDVSASMNAEDIKPTRLERAKRELQGLIRELEGDNLGLILFSDYAYVPCPLTRDHDALSLFLEQAQTEQFAQTGTHLRTALSKALERFNGQDSLSSSDSKAIIVVSDGEDFGDTYVSLVERLRSQKIKVFTVGIGTYDGAPIPELNRGNKIGYKTYPDGSMAISRLKDSELEFIADEFNTSYSVIENENSQLKKLKRQLENLNAATVQDRKEVASNQYQPFLYVSILLLFASLVILPVRKV